MASLVSKGIIVLKPENVAQLVFFIRGEKVMFDADLAMLYGVEVRSLNQAVARNRKRFPPDFAFQLTDDARCFEITPCDLKVANFSGQFPFEITSAREEIRRAIRSRLRSDQATHYSTRAAPAQNWFSTLTSVFCAFSLLPSFNPAPIFPR
jgi:hypothetical protein